MNSPTIDDQVSITSLGAVALSDQAFALGVRHADPPMDFELLDVNAIDHE